MKKYFKVPLVFLLVLATLTMSCRSMPAGAKPVSNFDVNRYLGTWYEIARLDHRFEKNIDNATAQYSLNDDGSVKVINRGYNQKKQKWTSAEGTAKFRGDRNVGALKVSFFGPFYAGYNVIAVDEAYQYALVAGKDLKYLWLLSREKTLPEDIKKSYLTKAQKLGYKTSELIWVKQDKVNPKLK